MNRHLALDAMALWEAMLQAQDSIPWLKKLWEQEGTAVMREHCLFLATHLDSLFTKVQMYADDIDLGAFDWDFCPNVLDCMKDGERLPTVDELIAHYRYIAGE